MGEGRRGEGGRRREGGKGEKGGGGGEKGEKERDALVACKTRYLTYTEITQALNGETALHCAAMQGHSTTVSLLIKVSPPLHSMCLMRSSMLLHLTSDNNKINNK